MSTNKDFFIHKGKCRTSSSPTPGARQEGMGLLLGLKGSSFESIPAGYRPANIGAQCCWVFWFWFLVLVCFLFFEGSQKSRFMRKSRNY